VTSCLKGTPLRLGHRSVVATNGRIHAEMTAALRG